MGRSLCGLEWRQKPAAVVSRALEPTTHPALSSASSSSFLPPSLPQGKEVEYSLRLLPLGGFVAFPDDDPESPYEREHSCRRRRRCRCWAALCSAAVICSVAGCSVSAQGASQSQRVRLPSPLPSNTTSSRRPQPAAQPGHRRPDGGHQRGRHRKHDPGLCHLRGAGGCWVESGRGEQRPH